MPRPPVARVLLWPGSPLALATLALPLCAGLLAGWRALGMSFGELAAVAPIRAYALALAAALAVSVLRGAFERRPGRCARSLGVLAVLAHGAVRALWSFSGILDAGEGEPPGAWARVAAGAHASRPPPVELREVSPSGSLRVAVADRELELAPGRSYRVSGGHLRILEESIAPRIVFRNDAGATLEDALFKLPRDRLASDYIEIPVLPHRFYLSPASSVRAGAPDAVQRLPDALHLKVTRGKLMLLDRDVAKGEVVKADHVAFQYLDGLPWARLELVREPGSFLLYAGVALLLAGAMLELRARRMVDANRPESALP